MGRWLGETAVDLQRLDLFWVWGLGADWVWVWAKVRPGPGSAGQIKRGTRRGLRHMLTRGGIERTRGDGLVSGRGVEHGLRVDGVVMD